MVDEVNTYEAEPQNPEGHVDEMVAVAEGLEYEGQNERPEWLPEKFQNPEDMAQAYLELEQRLGGQPQQQETQEIQEMEAQQEQERNDIESFLADRGLDFDKFALRPEIDDVVSVSNLDDRSSEFGLRNEDR